ncbi:MAG: IS110 family transposase [Thaumarchaeota archaeon]|nr:IS110 family transposase [Nitrososphaerota archaeon]
MSGNRNAQLLKTMPGIGNIVALALASEIGDISRFSDMDRLVSYFGLVPSVRNSADTVHHGRITKEGNSLVRHLLAEAVIVHVTFARNRKVSTPISEFYERLSKKRGGSKAKVAAAAKMLRIVFWMLKKKIDFWTCIEEGRKSTYREPRKKGSRRVKNHG